MEQPDLSDASLQALYARRVARREVDPSACVAPEAILAVVRQEGPEDERLATLEHVMSCPACHREYEWLSAVDQAALEAEGGSGPARRPWWRAAPLALAASLLVAVGAAIAVRQYAAGPEPERGGGETIALVSPHGVAAAGAPLIFAWHPLPGAPRYVLEVQRRDGTVAFTDTTADTTLTLDQPERVLPDADYRWWIREATDGAEPRSSPLRSLRLSHR